MAWNTRKPKRDGSYRVMLSGGAFSTVFWNGEWHSNEKVVKWMSEEKHEEKDEFVKCRNCGDKTAFASNADATRASLGICTGCYSVIKHQRLELNDGKVIWAEGKGQWRSRGSSRMYYD